MNGRKAKELRKKVYGDHSHRVRTYTETVVEKRVKGKVGIPVDRITVHADAKRKRYQKIKKAA